MSAAASAPATELTEYESRQIREIAEWKAAHPSVWAEAFRLAALPLARAVDKATPDRLVILAIDAVYDVAEKTALADDIKRYAGVRELAELRHRPLEECDRLALRVGAVAKGIAAVEGAATGAGGVLTTLVDIPLLFGLAVRTIIKVGHCYGFPLNLATDRAYVLGVLAAALSGSRERKQTILVRLREIEELLLEESQENLVVEEATSLLFQLEIFEEIPGVGAISGGVLNFSAMARTAETARRLFQQRWLRDNGKVDTWIAPAPDVHHAFAATRWRGVLHRAAYRGGYYAGFWAAWPVYLAATPLRSLGDRVTRGLHPDANGHADRRTAERSSTVHA